MTGGFGSDILADIWEDLESEEVQLAFEVQGFLAELLDEADINAKTREIVWEDGQVLSLRSSIQRLAREYPQYPFEVLERQFILWLEHFPLESYSQAQWDEYEVLSEQWLDEYAREFGILR